MTHLKFKHNPSIAWNKMFNPSVLNDVLENVLQHEAHDSAAMIPSVNILETKESYKIELAAAGLTKEDFKINLEKEVLTISSDKATSALEGGTKYTRKEFSFHSFKRSFNLPENANQDQIQAEYINGVLVLTIAKKIDIQTPVKEIKIS